MRFRHGAILGFAIGYYLGAKAGRERYEQIEEVLDRLRTSALYRQTSERIAEMVEEGSARARELLDDLTAGEGYRDASVPSIFGDPTLN
jgi:hypothetical protein